MSQCQCGCGQATPIAKRTRRHLGHIEGQPTPYARGHSARASRNLIARIQEHKRPRPDEEPA